MRALLCVITIYDDSGRDLGRAQSFLPKFHKNSLIIYCIIYNTAKTYSVNNVRVYVHIIRYFDFNPLMRESNKRKYASISSTLFFVFFPLPRPRRDDSNNFNAFFMLIEKFRTKTKTRRDKRFRYLHFIRVRYFIFVRV